MNEILTKVCFKCNTEKPITEFYKHPKMNLGVVGKCKECNKADVRKDYYRKSEDENWVEKERERGREKYKRLNYKTYKKQPHLLNSKLKNVHKKLNIPKGFEAHHWNYNKGFEEDVFIFKTKEHRQAHRFIKLDKEKLIFTDLIGNFLDTKEKHLKHLLLNGIF
jgi:hypothetical protein